MSVDWKNVSYVLGQQIGGDFKEQNIEIEVDTFRDSFKAAYNGEASTLSPEDTEATMQSFQAHMQALHTEKMGQAGAQNLLEGADFLTNNGKEEGVVTLDSGLQYKVLTEGNGNSPSATDTVETHYEGKLIDGSVFDSSYQRGETVSFPVNGVIPGWTEALQLMKEGAKWQLAIPAALAYGEAGSAPVIPPNATLVFDVELIAVK